MRDDMRVGDGVLFYHSNADPTGVAGLAEVARAAYPDATAFDPAHDHFDPKSVAAEPTWLQVDVRAVERFPRVITLAELRAIPALAGMELLRRGSRLSVQPVRPEEWAAVCAAGRAATHAG
jgi:predicted RNA-binding protein with PUA-like domain